MKKKLVMTLMMITLAGSLTACQDTKEEIEVIDFENISTKTAENQDSKQRYEDFLKGEESLFFHQYMPS